MYHGAIVTYPTTKYIGSKLLMQKVVEATKKLHTLLQVQKDFKKPTEELCSFDIAHHVGMGIQEEYDLLCLQEELHRQEYLKRHLQKIVEVLEQTFLLKERIILNGHFKNMEGFNF